MGGPCTTVRAMTGPCKSYDLEGEASCTLAKRCPGLGFTASTEKSHGLHSNRLGEISLTLEIDFRRASVSGLAHLGIWATAYT